MRVLIEIGYRIGLPDTLLHVWLRTGSATLHWSSPLDVMCKRCVQATSGR
jgi:hypothetical protein